jgi:hypothetical protein
MKAAKNDIISDKNLVAMCGLYCGACRSYLNMKCPGCKENEKASWCKIRKCCHEKSIESCAGCVDVEVRDCKNYTNIISRTFSLLFNSDREKCIMRIRKIGYVEYASEMSANKMQTIRRR